MVRVKIFREDRLLDDFFQVDVAELKHETFDGQWSPLVRRFNLNRGEAVAILIYVQDSDRLIMVRQFRYAVHVTEQNGWIDEIVAGVVEGDNAVSCAYRECIEEAGYEIKDLQEIATIYSSPGITTERIHVFIGYCDQKDKKHAGGGVESENEDIKLVELSREEAYNRLINRRIKDGKTLLALQHFFLKHPRLMPQ
ncbi:MAG: NUDIX domain-containing protein [Caldithrix sp.]|nr:NUDIX domain-containing protein [Caldithrix sp.]